MGRTPDEGRAGRANGDEPRIDAAAAEPKTGRLVLDQMRLDLVAEAKRALRDGYLVVRVRNPQSNRRDGFVAGKEPRRRHIHEICRVATTPPAAKRAA